MEKIYKNIVSIFAVSKKKDQLLPRIFYGMCFTEKRNLEEFFKWTQSIGTNCKHGIMFTYPAAGADAFSIEDSFVSSLVVNGPKVSIIPVQQEENEKYLTMYDAGLSFQEKLLQNYIRKFIIRHMIQRRQTIYRHLLVTVILPSFNEQ